MIESERPSPTPFVEEPQVVTEPVRETPVKLLIRGLFGRCPICGGGSLFARRFQMKSRCPNCNYDFEREEGWWIGAIIMNTAAAFVLFGLYFPLSLILTWPDVPWTLLTVIGVLIMGIFPVIFYPISKTLWLAVDIILHRWR